MNDENLIPISQRTSNELREMAVKGGIKSGKVRRERKKMREDLLALLDAKLTDDEGKKITVQKKICNAWIQQALKGNMIAIKELRDTIGEVVVQKQEVSGNVGVEKVYITKEEKQEALDHIKDFIKD